MTTNIYPQLTEPIPPEHLLPRPDGLTNIRAYYVIDRLNRIFGPMGWHAVHLHTDIHQDEVVMRIRLNIATDDHRVSKEAEGSCDIRQSMGDAIKGARTNAICKAASFLGIGIEVYRGDADVVDKLPGDINDSRPRPPAVKKKKRFTPYDTITEFSKIKGEQMPEGATWDWLFHHHKDFLKWLMDNGAGGLKKRAKRTLQICGRAKEASSLYVLGVEALLPWEEYLGISADEWVSGLPGILDTPKTLKAANSMFAKADEHNLITAKLVTLCHEASGAIGKSRDYLKNEAKKHNLKDITDPSLTEQQLDLILRSVRKKAEKAGVSQIAEDDIPF